MIADALRADIETYARHARKTNPLFTRAADGSLLPAHITHYLSNIHHLVAQTPPNLRRAEARARAVGLGELATHYGVRLSEETGHEEWAVDDLAALRAAAPGPGVRLEPALVQLLGYLHEIIDEEPTLYLSYCLFAEQLTVLLGGDWLALLEERCGIPRAAMTVVDRHVELDIHHVEEALESIDALVVEPRMLPRLREVLATSIQYFDRFCRQIAAHDHAAAPAA